MKKSILMLIGVIYILSIVAVSFYGLSIKNYNENKYPDSISLLTESDTENGIYINKSNANTTYYEIYTIYINPYKVDSLKLDFELTRNDGIEVSNKNLKYYIAMSSDGSGMYNEYINVASDGTVTFTGECGGAELWVSSSVKDTVKLLIRFNIKEF